MEVNNPDTIYLSLAKEVLERGEEREDRTGTGTISLFAPPEMRFDLTKGFPLLTTKKLPFRIIVEELLWFLSGSTNVRQLQSKNVHIWDADYERWKRQGKGEDGSLGPIYGGQWRKWVGVSHEGQEIRIIDQIQELINSLKNNPTSRRHIVSAWNVGQLNDMALPPCHVLFQAYVHNDGGLSLKMYQRSSDVFLGMPFNIASYSLLTHLLAHELGLYAREFIWSGGDTHIYKNHIEQIKLQMTRKPRALPTIKLNPEVKSLFDFTYDDIELIGYDPHPPIKGEISAG